MIGHNKSHEDEETIKEIDTAATEITAEGDTHLQKKRNMYRINEQENDKLLAFDSELHDTNSKVEHVDEHKN